MEWGSGSWLRRGEGGCAEGRRDRGRGKEEENARGSLVRRQEEEVGSKHERKVLRGGKSKT